MADCGAVVLRDLQLRAKLKGNRLGRRRDLTSRLVEAHRKTQKRPVFAAFDEPSAGRGLTRADLGIVDPFEVDAEEVAIAYLEERPGVDQMIRVARIWNALVRRDLREALRSILERELDERPRPEEAQAIGHDDRDQAADHQQAKPEGARGKPHEGFAGGTAMPLHRGRGHSALYLSRKR